jgi:DNA-binding NtrC family response regulator
MSAQVLLVDDERLLRGSVAAALAQSGHEVRQAASLGEAERLLGELRADVLVLDLKLGDGDGLDLLRKLRAAGDPAKVVVISAHGTVERAIEAMRLGAYDFVRKPFELEELVATVGNAARAAGLERRVAYHDARERVRAEPIVPPASAAMQRLEREVSMIVGQPVPIILLVGETGTGKALVARRLHFESPRRDGPFVELNVAAMPESLVESELFGHERGAFSDARERKPGLAEVADGGTLFLDEIGEMSLPAQAKLLTFLESFRFRRVGGTAQKTVDIRLVAATNRDLPALVKEGRFRGDLHYRLAAVTLEVPPLRARTEDIPPLALGFVTHFAQRFHKRMRAVSPAALAVLTSWRWPGNVRELRGVIQRAVLMHDGEVLEPEHLPPELVAARLDPLPTLEPGRHIPTLDEVALRYMRNVLELTNGNKARAAEYLGITRQTLAKRLDDAE